MPFDCEPREARIERLNRWIKAHKKEEIFLEDEINRINKFRDEHTMVVHGLGDVVSKLMEIQADTKDRVKECEEELKNLKE